MAHANFTYSTCGITSSTFILAHKDTACQNSTSLASLSHRERTGETKICNSHPKTHALLTKSNTPAATLVPALRYSSRLDGLVSGVALLPANEISDEDDQHQPSKRRADDDGNKHLVLIHLTLLR